MKKNQRGFSLVEVMLAVGFLGGAGLIMMNIQKNSSQVQTKMDVDQDIEGITSQIGQLLSRKQNCQQTLSGKELNDPIKGLISVITSNSGDPIFKIGGSGPNTILGRAKLKIKSMVLESKDANGNYVDNEFNARVKVTFSYEQGKLKSGQLEKEVHRYFSTPVRRDSSQKVIACRTAGDELEREAWSNACKAYGANAEIDSVSGEWKCSSAVKDRFPKCFLSQETSCPATGYSQSEDVVIALKVTGRRSCWMELSPTYNSLCGAFYAGWRGPDVDRTWNWPGNCECSGTNCECNVMSKGIDLHDTPCKASDYPSCPYYRDTPPFGFVFQGISCQWNLQKKCVDSPGTMNVTFKYCCRN